MARKAIRGYTEKSYYDNTTFKGIVATTDPLNEGSFAHMVNFDISDTGSSIKPRCGFLTTDFVIKEGQAYNTVKLKADSTLYFYEPSLQQYIFVDFSTFKFTSEELGDYTYSISAYAVAFNAEIVEGHTNKHFVATRITNVDLDDIINLFVHNDEDDYKNIRLGLTRTVFKNTLAQHITDDYLISKYIIKHRFNAYTPYTWIELYYRKEGSSYEDITFDADTVVISFVNTEDIASIDSNNRNIASTKSIIPDPLQKIYPEDSKDLAYNQFPFIYTKDNSSGKYISSTTDNLDITLIPHFLLRENVDKSTWAYSYTITSTRYNNNITSDNTCYSSLYSISTNENINSMYTTYLQSEAEKVSKVDSDWKLVHLNSLVNEVSPDNIASVYFYWMYASALATPNFEQFYGLRSLYSGYYDSDDNTDEHMFSDLLEYSNRVNFSDYDYYTSRYFTDSVLVYVVPNIDKSKIQVFNNGNVIIDELWHFMNQLSDDMQVFNDSNCSTYSRAHAIVTKFNGRTNISNKELISILSSIDCKDIRFIIVPFSDITETFTYDKNAKITKEGLKYYKHYSMYTGILFDDTDPVSVHELCTYLRSNQHTNIVFKYMQTAAAVDIESTAELKINDSIAAQVMPSYSKLMSRRDNNIRYYIYTADTPISSKIDVGNVQVNDTGAYLPHEDHLYQYFYIRRYTFESGVSHYTSSVPLLAPVVYNPDRTSTSEILSKYRCLIDVSLWIPHSISITEQHAQSHFNLTDGLLYLDVLDPKLKDLRDRGYFDNGVNLTMYITPHVIYETLNDLVSNPYTIHDVTYIHSYTPLFMSTLVTLGAYPTYIIDKLQDDPYDIIESNKWCVFHSEQGDRLVTWVSNKVYVSEANNYYYFKDANKYTYPEKVLKVIQFKNTLLVFTPINLYSIYPYEDTIMVESGKDEEGNTQYVQNKVIYYATLPVLYNLMLTEQYIDAIQVFNQMVLFYSADGQLFMIKPTATIDNDTKFTIQYFNKSANDILANYDTYMNERLQVYGYSGDYLISDKTKVGIKVQVNINYIKIFYTYKDYTYILIYDVINNYFYSYDTMSFSDIKDIFFTEEGDVYVSTSHLGDKEKYLFFTTKNNRPNEVDNNIDEAIYNNFVNYDIKTELDTGILNLNTHLKKRFRDLHTVYKNITATYLNMEVETFIDCVPAQVVFNDSIEVKSSTTDGAIEHVYDCVEIKNTNDILKQNALFDFSLFTSNKMLTHYTNIPCLGKQFRLRLRFNSKGVYKLQSYGITFKEHQI